jgi:predicted Fe-S protein YdhL (DUF1289 family)
MRWSWIVLAFASGINSAKCRDNQEWRENADLRRNREGLHRPFCCTMWEGILEANMTQIESPCILVCSMDIKTGYCFGCGRTRDEISGWITMAPETRREIMNELPARLETVERKPRRETRRSRMARERSETSS